MFISFNFKKGYLFIFVFIVFQLVYDNFLSSKMKKETNYMILSVAQAFLVICYFVEKNLSKNKTNNPKMQKFFRFEKTQSRPYIKYLIVFFTISFSLIYFISLYRIKETEKNNQFNYYLKCIFICLIDMIFFKKEFLAHQFLSFMINLLIFIIFLIIYFNSIKSISVICWFILYNYCNAFHFLLIQYLNIKYFINVYLIGSILGLSNFIFDLFYFIFRKKNFSFIDIDDNDYLIILFFFLFYFIKHYVTFLIIFNYGAIFPILCHFISECICFSMKKGIKNFGTYLIIYLAALISGMIYLEIIELHFCDLDYNLKVNIQKRAIIHDKTLSSNFIDDNNNLEIEESIHK